MSKKYSPTSISSKLTRSKKDLPQSQQNDEKRSRGSQKSSGQQSSQSSGKKSELSQSQISLTQQKVMQQAIEKASCLIELLTRQNSDSKLYINDLLQELSELKSKQQELQSSNNRLLQQLALTQNHSENLQKQNEQLLFQLQKIKLLQNDKHNTKQKLEQSKTKNKKLHEKIAFMTKNNLQLNKELENLKRQYKSLQNQNTYLLEELKKSQFKQNVFHQNLSFKQNSFQRKLKDIQTTKQAFATRTHELKEENLALLKEIEKLRMQKYDLELISRQSMQTLDAVTKKIEFYRYVEEKVHRIYEKIKFVMQEGTIQPFSRTQMNVKQKMQQIEMLVTYRVQHIENLMKKICERVEKPEWKCNLRELNEAKILAQRLSTYLSELSTKPHLQF